MGKIDKKAFHKSQIILPCTFY